MKQNLVYHRLYMTIREQVFQIIIIKKFLVSFLENALCGHVIMYAVLVLHSLSLRCV